MLSLNKLDEVDDLRMLYATEMMPPMPTYMIAAGSLSTIAILLCLSICQYFPRLHILTMLATVGRLSLTLYVAHVIVGMGTLEALGLLTSQSIEVAVLSSLMFCAFSMAFSVVWLRYFKYGPLEWVFRHLSK